MKRNLFSPDGNLSFSSNIRTLIGEAPTAGKGVHQWLFVAALKLHGRRPDDEIFQILRDSVRDCGRFVSDSEIQDAVINSARIAGRSVHVPGAERKERRWPEADQNAIGQIASHEGNALLRLLDAGISGNLEFTSRIGVTMLFESLFPGDPLVCAGNSLRSMRCRRLSAWLPEIASTQFVVPSPMTAPTGINRSGTHSTRCLGNTGPRRFLVIEFDEASIYVQAALHLHLAQRFPLALIVHSGGKSLHGWYYVESVPEPEVEAFMRYAVALGADHHTWTRCQAVRTPGGIRRDSSGSREQHVLFFNHNYAQ